VGVLPGKTDQRIVIGAHYDTKTFTEFKFVGANDGGSGIGVLLELARVLAPGAPYRKTLVFAAFDGEESLASEPMGVGLYGSNHFVLQNRKNGTLKTIKDFILLDMIGDADLDINTDTQSSQDLHDLVWAEARRQGVAKAFSGPRLGVVDDHTAFVGAGVPSLDLIDFQFGSAPGRNDYWHTDKDTLDKIRPQSLQTVGRVVVAVVKQLAR
jgi:Zn-dependent M28 family amino/carboxypeptidase